MRVSIITGRFRRAHKFRYENSNLSRLRCAHGHVQIPQQSSMQSVNPTVHGEFLPSSPRILHDRGRGNVAHLLDDVQLAESIDRLRFRKTGNGFRVLLMDILDVSQPVIAETKPISPHRRAYAT